MTTLLDELRWLGGDARAARRWSWRQRISVLLVLAGVMTCLAAVIYVEQLQPIGFGNETGPGALAVISDGVSDTGWLLRSGASPATATISISNNSRVDIRILGIGEGIDTESPISVKAVTRYEEVLLPHVGYTDKAVPFAPFALHAGESVTVDVSVVAGRCSAGHAVALTAIPVRWSLGWRKTTSPLSLEYPIKRACGDGPLKPQVTEPPTRVDDGWQSTDYDFAAPPGWVASPLGNFGGPASFAYWRKPGSNDVLTYEENGGMAGVLYAKGDHPGAAEARQLVDCKVTSFRDVGGGIYGYTCAPIGRTLRQGFLLVLDAPQGFRRIEISTSDRGIYDAFPDHVKH